MSNDVHDIDFCKRVMKHPQISQQAGKLFAGRAESRGYTKDLTANFLVNTLGSVSDNNLITPFKARPTPSENCFCYYPLFYQ